MKNFSNAGAVITGGANGLGRGLALALAARGTNIVIADRDRAGAERTAKDVQALGVNALAVLTDVADAAAVRHLADVAYDRFGSVQLLVNNAAVWEPVPLWEMTPEDWRWILAVNVEGVANGLAAFLPRMMQQSGERHIVITSSTNGLWIMPGQGAYNTTKYALIGLSEALASDVAGRGIKVSVICPGPMNTTMGERSHPPSLGGAAAITRLQAPPKELAEMFATWGMLDPLEAGRLALRGIEDEEFYILTHAAGWPMIAARHERLAQAFARRRTW